MSRSDKYMPSGIAKFVQVPLRRAYTCFKLVDVQTHNMIATVAFGDRVWPTIAIKNLHPFIIVEGQDWIEYFKFTRGCAEVTNDEKYKFEVHEREKDGSWKHIWYYAIRKKGLNYEVYVPEEYLPNQEPSRPTTAIKNSEASSSGPRPQRPKINRLDSGPIDKDQRKWI